jgi:hypothetical protein
LTAAFAAASRGASACHQGIDATWTRRTTPVSIRVWSIAAGSTKHGPRDTVALLS